jgi:hypothetical protein
MPKQYTREELWKLYEKLPRELKETIFAEETANYIGSVCERYNISEETISEAAKQVGNVLLGILPPDEFQGVLEKELKLKKEVAKKVAQEIHRFIFYPVKPALEELYKIEISPPAKPTGITPPPEEKPSVPQKEDVYREPVE